VTVGHTATATVGMPIPPFPAVPNGVALSSPSSHPPPGPNGNNAIPQSAPPPGVQPQQQYCAPTSELGENKPPPQNPSPLSFSGKTCRIQGCGGMALARRPYCVRHSGSRLCEHPGCTKCAQGSTRFCIAHGGGRRCTYPGCDKGARDKFFCAAHGGGKRCISEGCKKSAVGGSKFCTSHGGGKRCSVNGCTKSAQSSTKFCVKHGGGKKCASTGCGKVARGKTLYCAAHGGGVRCKLEGCNRVAIGKIQLCRVHGGGLGSRAKGAAAAVGVATSTFHPENNVTTATPTPSVIVSGGGVVPMAMTKPQHSPSPPTSRIMAESASPRNNVRM